MKLTLDRMGRIVVPKPLRERLALKPGDSLEVALEPDGLRLRPVALTPVLEKQDGILVCTSEVPLAAWDLGRFMEEERSRRSRELGGM